MTYTAINTYKQPVGSGAVPYAILSPPFHLKTDLSGLTILVCVVHDIHQGELEVAWISSGTRGINPAVSNLLQGHSGIQNTMSVISVPSNEWMSYTCFNSPPQNNHFRRLDDSAGCHKVSFKNNCHGCQN
ncbi:hypothetical protein Q8A67_003829 [Cirrhinus molitorella]|uniref:Ig-like domain-containing protein n=1 Tax=Cirrhinus molitorella TaxID=172907 RepID=A0AA88QGB0_9TELE|nr:hypothetical protein Q8A67_003829 [Cirrhinus molitorella]